MTKSDQNLFHVQLRKTLGKAVKQLRNQGLVPGNIFGLKQDSVAVTCSVAALNKHLQEEGQSGLVYLKIGEDGLSVPTLVDEIQVHPTTDSIQHISFRRVKLDEAVETEVSIELIGEADIPDANVLQVLDTIQLSALPTDIPEKIEVDISSLVQVGDSILLKELPIDLSKIKLMVESEDLEKPVVLVQAQAEEVEPEPEVVVEGEGEEGAETGDEKEGEEKSEDGGDKPKEKSPEPDKS
jgi:large subunit ribosomal protein L25